MNLQQCRFTSAMAGPKCLGDVEVITSVSLDIGAIEINNS